MLDYDDDIEKLSIVYPRTSVRLDFPCKFKPPNDRLAAACLLLPKGLYNAAREN